MADVQLNSRKVRFQDPSLGRKSMSINMASRTWPFQATCRGTPFRSKWTSGCFLDLWLGSWVELVGAD